MATTTKPSPEGRGSARSRYSTKRDAVAADERREKRREARGRRYRLRRQMRSVTRLDRVSGCGVAAVDEFVPVHMRDGEAGFGGIITCGSVWACAPCSAKIRQRKADVVEQHALRWLAEGHGLLFVTLTRAHTMADDLGPLLDSVSDAWKAVREHRRFRTTACELGYVGPLRAVEITHGYNGWHPHLHLLLWFEKPLTDNESDAMEDAIADVWLGNVDASRRHGVRSLRVGRRQSDASALSAYLVKLQDGYDDARPKSQWNVAAEMTRGDLKKGRSAHRTPFEIAEAATMGDKRAVALWRVYERATKGRRCIQWGSKLLRRLNAVDVPDEDLAGETLGVVVFELSRPEWNLLRGYHAEARFLDALERGGTVDALGVLRAALLRARFDHARGRPARSAVGQRVKLVA